MRRPWGGGSISIWNIYDSQNKLAVDAIDFEVAWENLASHDAPKGFLAIQAFLRNPDKGLKALQDKTPQVVTPDSHHVTNLLTTLDAADFQKRERASADLLKLGKCIIPALNSYAKRELSDEALQRVWELQRTLSKSKFSSEEMRSIRTVEIVELMQSVVAMGLLEQWSKGTEFSLLTTEAQSALKRMKSR